MIQNSTKALILGGGAGTRLQPLTRYRSKPAVTVAGKYRLVDIPISNCLHSNIREIFVLTQFNSASLNQHIKNTYQFDGFYHGYVDILAAQQTPGSSSWYQGTADAIRQVYGLPKLRSYDSGQDLILSGDHLYQMDYSRLLTMHRGSGATLTIATMPVSREDARDFGIMKTNRQGYITDFIEKPSEAEVDNWKSDVPRELKEQGKEYLASMGVYVFNRRQLVGLLNDHPEAHDFGRDIIPLAITAGVKISSFPFTGYWADIGSIPSYYQANLELTDPQPRFSIDNLRKGFFTEKNCLSASKILNTMVDRSIIAEGCIIHAERIERSIIGRLSHIGSGTVITNSIIMGNDYLASVTQMDQHPDSGSPPVNIGNGCRIEKVIIDKNCRIGDHVTIIGGDHLKNVETPNYSVVDGIVVIPRDTYIPDGSVIGEEFEYADSKRHDNMP
ncbi:MAG: glucose-1-phosphate adenylyltransferase [Cyclonatronaceae bacterium]